MKLNSYNLKFFLFVILKFEIFRGDEEGIEVLFLITPESNCLCCFLSFQLAFQGPSLSSLHEFGF